MFRGYTTSHELAQMLDLNITSRHTQRLEGEEVSAHQHLQTLRLQNEMALSTQQNERETQKKQLALALQEQEDEFEATKRAKKHQLDLKMELEAHQQRLKMAEKQDEATLSSLTKMKEIGIDLDRYIHT